MGKIFCFIRKIKQEHYHFRKFGRIFKWYVVCILKVKRQWYRKLIDSNFIIPTEWWIVSIHETRLWNLGEKVLKIAAYANFERRKTGWPRKLFLLPANPEIEPVAGWLRSCTKDFVFLYSMRWFYYERSWMRNEVSRDEVF